MGQAEAISAELNQVTVIRDFQAALERRKLPRKTSVEDLLRYVYREGAQVAKLIPDARIRLHLIEQEQQ